MIDSNEGLTDTYNRFHNPKCADKGIQKLRDLHVRMDTAVRDAYGWQDLDLEHGWIKTVHTQEKKDRRTGKVRTVEKVEHRFTISERARQEVLRRLLDLNHKLYAEEVDAGLHDKVRRKKAAKKKKSAGKKKPTTMSLFGDDAFPGDPVAPPGPDLVQEDNPEKAILAALEKNKDWQAKAEIIAASGIKPGQWNRVVNALIESGLVERKGQKRGTRYRAPGKQR